jgi:hypothetical protein
VRLDGTVTIGEATFRPDDLRGTISWETKRSPSGITTLLRSPDLVGQVAMQNVTQAEVNAHRTTADLLEFLAPRVLATDVDVTPVDTYEIVDPGDGSVRAVPVGALVGPDDCIAAASYAVNGVEGIISVVVPGCGGSGGVELDSYVDAGTDQRRYVAYLPALIVPAIVGRTG